GRSNARDVPGPRARGLEPHMGAVVEPVARAIECDRVEHFDIEGGLAVVELPNPPQPDRDRLVESVSDLRLEQVGVVGWGRPVAERRVRRKPLCLRRVVALAEGIDHFTRRAVTRATSTRRPSGEAVTRICSGMTPGR